MLSATQTICRPARPSTASRSRFAELVRKIGTSATRSSKKRRSKARRRVLQATEELRRFALGARLRAVVLTLTFANDASFSPRHISAFLACVRQMLKRRGHVLPYAWVLERAARLHYHLVLWLPRDISLDRERLKKWWPWGSTWTQGCRSVKAWGRYMAKLGGMAFLPKGARVFGYGGLDASGKRAVQRVALPQWLRSLVPIDARVRAFPSGGWVDADTGEHYRSPYVWTPRGCVMRK
ncbi:inovirus Gp2 family protein [Ralstonia solanacearum]|nr:inovirus Gp2 family protein [Ralstonia solanacearum]